MRKLFYIFLTVVALNCTAEQVADVGCMQLRVVLDEKVTSDVIEKEWGSGDEHFESPAVLQLIGCDGRVIDRHVLAAPLAKIDPMAIKGAKHPTFLVSVDLSADAGSYNGPLTIPFQIVGDRLAEALVHSVNRPPEVLRLSQTGKSSWTRVPRGSFEDLLQVSSHHLSNGFRASYKRYSVGALGWRVREITRKGLWESDQPFPNIDKFPK